MGLLDEHLWDLLKCKAVEEDSSFPPDKQIADSYLTAVKKIALYGIERSKTIRDTFPLYTLHDETHIIGVMRLMEALLGNHIDKLSRDELAMLILAACCHDIGMSYSEPEKESVLSNRGRLLKYLDGNHSEYVSAFSASGDGPQLTESIKRNYLRSIHHERAEELLRKIDWPDVLFGKVACKDLITICKSHGQEISSLEQMESTRTVDLRLCAILLRLADILDFDDRRTPQAIYEYSSFSEKNDSESKYSDTEWQKHLSSEGFDFDHLPEKERQYPYELDYFATCKSMQIEQAIHNYLDWVDKEFHDCRQLLASHTGKHSNFVLPRKVKRNIDTVGYMSGEYRLTLDQGQVMELLVGRNLYHDPGVFVRELLQNAIDAVRTREKMDRNLPSAWKPQISISSWMDKEGFHWFRIEDNGIGMSEDIIRNYFLKIGRSYYSSDTFKKDKLRCNADPDYTPISRFGIGILSCFMGNEKTNLVEISTKRFSENDIEHPALRMRMNGLSGYYYLANSDSYHTPGPMYGRTEHEKSPYLLHAGTAIAVRTNLYQTGKYRNFKEIVDQYVVCPPVPVRYTGDEGVYDYPTKHEFMKRVHDVCASEKEDDCGLLKISMSDTQIDELQENVPNLVFSQIPTLNLKCASLEKYTNSPYLSGVVLLASISEEHEELEIMLDRETSRLRVNIEPVFDTEAHTLGIKIEPEFDEEFSIRMKHLDSHLGDRYHYLMREGGKKFPWKRHKDREVMAHLLDAVMGGQINDPSWEMYMQHSYDLSPSVWNAKVETALNALGTSRNELQAYHLYDSLKDELEFTMCKLTDYDWYRELFLDLRNRTHCSSIVSHNGIRCGGASFFRRELGWKDESKLGTIILLQDRYRPEVDIARDGIRQLPLELMCELELIREKLQSQGFDVRADSQLSNENQYAYISQKEYMNLLKERPDFIERFSFMTTEGQIDNAQLRKKISQDGCIKLTGIPKRKSNSFYNDSNNLINFLRVAYLQDLYVLQVHFDRYRPMLFITAKSDMGHNNYPQLLPPALFLPTTQPVTYFTTQDTYCRVSCNINHKLSQFIVNNCEALECRVPGLFHEILRSISEDNSDLMITKVNDVLDRMRNLPDLGIDIDANIRLEKTDFSK